jgi:signal transduction histidine kinase/ActR/RegA family two-component response regulator
MAKRERGGRAAGQQHPEEQIRQLQTALKQAQEEKAQLDRAHAALSRAKEELERRVEADRGRGEPAPEKASRPPRQEGPEEMKAREAAQARLFQTLKLEALGQLTGGVAHDFNNLLSVIVGGTALLRNTTDPVRHARLVDAIAQAARRGAELTRRLLTFSRRQSLRPQPIELGAWLAEMRELLARVLREDIAVEIATPPELWPVLADPAELELAVVNLALNARDAMPRGGRLRIAATNVAIEGQRDPDLLQGEFVRLVVEDSGTGMPPEVLARVFEPFFSTKDVGQGTGLGLAHVYGFARQSGGAVRIGSRAGEGTTVTLLLPRAKQRAAAPGAPAPHRPTDDADGRMRLLLVEDNNDVAALTTDMLRHLGHEVTRVTSAPEALKALREGLEADLVLTDVVMPGGQDGVDLAQRLAVEHPSLPVLLCSGFGGAPWRVATAGLPLLRKPFGLEELQRALAEARERPRPATRPLPDPA